MSIEPECIKYIEPDNDNKIKSPSITSTQPHLINLPSSTIDDRSENGELYPELTLYLSYALKFVYLGLVIVAWVFAFYPFSYEVAPARYNTYALGYTNSLLDCYSNGSQELCYQSPFTYDGAFYMAILLSFVLLAFIKELSNFKEVFMAWNREIIPRPLQIIIHVFPN